VKTHSRLTLSGSRRPTFGPPGPGARLSRRSQPSAPSSASRT